MTNDAILKEFMELLKSTYAENLKEVFLFGSRARGDHREESDIDLLIVLERIADRETEFGKVFRIERLIERNYGDQVIISSILTTQEEFHSKLDPLYLNVRKEGVLL